MWTYAAHESLIIYVTLTGMRSRTMENYLPGWTPQGDRVFVFDNLSEIGQKINKSAVITFIDGAKSIPDFAHRFRKIINQ